MLVRIKFFDLILLTLLAEAHFHELEKSLREGGNTAFLRACAEVAEKGSRRTLAIRALTSIVANMKENDEHTANFAAVKT